MSDSIVEKIKKLLRLGRSNNPHEAELALSRAFELAARHKIDMENLDLDDESAGLVHEYFHIGKRVSFIRKRMLNIVVNFFHVAVCVSTPKVVFVGTASDVIIAHYVFEFLVGECSRWLRVYQAEEKRARRGVTKNKRANFVQGFVYGIARQLDQSRDQLILEDSKFAIIMAEQAKARNARLSELIPKTEEIEIAGPRRNETALVSGYIRGQQTKIKEPMARPEQLLLT